MEHEQVEQRDSNPVVLRKDPKEEFKVVSLQLDFFSQFKKNVVPSGFVIQINQMYREEYSLQQLSIILNKQ